MKIIIACLNSKYIHYSTAPWCLGAGLREFAKTKPSFSVFQSTVNADLDDFANTLISQAPDLVSMSCYIWNLPQTLYVCEKVKNATACKIVLGGPEVSYNSKEVLCKYPFVDFVLSGEGEFCFPAFVDALGGSADLSCVEGLTFRKSDEIISVPEGRYTKTPPSPYTDEYLTALAGRICYIESSRGCPYRCAFCLSGRVSPLRFFDLDVVKPDILKLANSGTRTVKFVDRTFNSNEAHANEILSFIKENYGSKIPKGVCFHFEIAGDILKESTMSLLEHMPKGAVQLEIGMQSFNEQTLLSINRKTNTKKLISNIKRLLSFGNMHIHIDLIAGLTGEDIASFENSFNIGYSLRAHMLQMGFLKLLHGAAMREEPEKYPCEFNSQPPYEVTSTPWLDSQELLLLKKCEDALERTYNSGRFHLTLEFLLRQTLLTPFALFCEMGEKINGEGKSLTEYAESIFEYYKDKCDADILFEKITCDLLCSTATLPPRFKTMDKRYKKLKALFPKNIKIALLPKTNRVIAVDPDGERDLFFRLGYKIYDVNDLTDRSE